MQGGKGARGGSVVQLTEIKEADGEQVYGKDVEGNFVVA